MLLREEIFPNILFFLKFLWWEVFPAGHSAARSWRRKKSLDLSGVGEGKNLWISHGEILFFFFFLGDLPQGKKEIRMGGVGLQKNLEKDDPKEPLAEFQLGFF